MNKEQFNDRITKQRHVSFTAPELEIMFKHLDSNRDGLIYLAEWTDKIYEDNNNPLQMLREVIKGNDISADELLHKMQI